MVFIDSKLYATIKALDMQKIYKYRKRSSQADTIKYFLWHLSAKTMPLWVQYCISKIMYRILWKTEGSRPYQTHFSVTDKHVDSTQIYTCN